MGTITFYTGTVKAGKTTSMILTARNMEYACQKVSVGVCARKPHKGKYYLIKTRNDSIERIVNFVITPQDEILYEPGIKTILIDEAQWLTKKQIQDLVKIAAYEPVDILCYGLTSTYTGEPWEGSSYLLAYSTDVKHIGLHSYCLCGQRATMNVLVDEHNNSIFSGKHFVPGGNFIPVCLKCWIKGREIYYDRINKA